jgi:hypothetical protein
MDAHLIPISSSKWSASQSPVPARHPHLFYVIRQTILYNTKHVRLHTERFRLEHRHDEGLAHDRLAPRERRREDELGCVRIIGTR